MNNSSRKIWEQPWGYAEGFIVAGGIVIAGLMLQLTLGNINPTLFASPINIILGALFVIGLLATHFFAGRNRIVRWLSGVYATVPSIIVLIVLCVFLGVLPQFAFDTPTEHLPPNFFSILGWHSMTTSWPFVLSCLYMLIILGLTTLRRTKQKQTVRDFGFYLNHLGLFLSLFCGIIGSADLERLTMSVSEGNVEWRAMNNKEEIRELNLAIQLDTFTIEEYEPKLVVIESETGRMLPAARPESYMYEGIGKTTQLAGVTVEILDYYPDAVIFRDSTFSNVAPMKMDGATSAIKVKATKPGLDNPVEGWVTNGSYLLPHSLLKVDDKVSIAMPPQEVKKYSSYVTIYTEEGLIKNAVIEVNKPLSVDNWTIYQYSYDDSMGKYSDTSIFELVRDPWLKMVYTGIIMLMAGALFIFIAGPKQNKV